ncbi:UbiA prenyltransferase family-domain-containing protein [Earliella scabrosa]|nr:UbiA prenyltransferase family-domain-containing protein [Earliella scabrosa]
MFSLTTVRGPSTPTYPHVISIRFSRPLAALRESCVYHAYTAFLFTKSDLKTILFPVTAFACAVAPVYSFRRLLLGMTWIWAHQLMCNVSNQASTPAEDALNKPWRPLPAGRVSERKARLLRWLVVLACLTLSASIGLDLLCVTLGLLLTTFLYDEMGLAGHYIGKNLCNIGGYTTIEIGATKLMGATRDLDRVSMFAVCLSGALIFTTIQAQDFADTEGDSALGRVTFPIYAPEFSRTFTLFALIAWSCGLSAFWDIGPAYRAAFIGLGALVGWRYYSKRTVEADCRSYVLYNIWLTIAHILPIHARLGIFSL